MKYKFIKEHRKEFGFNFLIDLLEVSGSGYYKYVKENQSNRQRENMILRKEIKKIFDEHKSRYGVRRITKELRKRGYRYNRKRVTRIMQKEGLQVVQKQKYRATTNSCGNRNIFPNLLSKKSKASYPGEILVSDITYIPTEEGWLYLAAVMDLLTRKILGYSMSSRINSQLVHNACKSASRGIQKPGVFHSDRGSQYGSSEVIDFCKNFRMKQSMSRKGNPYDNAAMESFFHTLKVELVNRKKYKTRDQARQDIFEYIEIYYNKKRMHSAIDYLTPYEAEMKYLINNNVV